MTAALLLTATGISAAGQKQEGKEDWKEKMMSEKVAFLTMEIGLTVEEAQLFWPVYNQVQEEWDKAMCEVMKSYRAMCDAIQSKKSEKEVANLLEAYLDAQKKMREFDNGTSHRYKAVLPAGKVAKLYMAEEKFRRQHIRRLHDKPRGENK